MGRLFDMSGLLAGCILYLEVGFLMFCNSSKLPGSGTYRVQCVGQYLHKRFFDDFDAMAGTLLLFVWPLLYWVFPFVSWLLGIVDCYSITFDPSSVMDWTFVLVETTISVGMYNTILFGVSD